MEQRTAATTDQPRETMQRITLVLTESQVEWLTRRAGEETTSASDIARRALRFQIALEAAHRN